MIRPVVVLALFLALSGCGANPLSVLTGGGPSVAANVQGGKTNTQTVGQSRVVEQTTRPVARDNAVERLEQTTRQQTADTVTLQCERVERLEQTVNEKDSPWLVWSLILAVACGVVGLIAPQPRIFHSWFERGG